MNRKLLHILMVAGGLSATSAVMAQGLDLPIVPASVMKQNVIASTSSTDVSSSGDTSVPQLTRASEKPLSLDGAPVSVPAASVPDQSSPQDEPEDVKKPKRVKTLSTVSSDVKRDMSPKPSKVNDTSEADVASTETNTIHVENGVNQVLNIAVGHLNRIVTPFASPRVKKTAQDVVTQVEENVVYIAPSVYKKPVTMYIREEGTESVAISLTLIPMRIPPQEYELRLNRRVSMGSQQPRPLAERWEKSNGYLQSLRNLPRSLALGQIPQGFEFRQIDPSEQIPYCAQKGLSFDFSNGQVLEGHNLQAVIGVVKNVSAAPVEFIESNCAQPGVRAVAAWPQPFLQPGERSEVFVVGARATKVAPQTKRPSLLEGGE